MNTQQPARRRREQDYGLDRVTRNRIIREWLTFNLNLDHCTGRAASPDVAPYNEWKRPAVEKLMREFKPDQQIDAPSKSRRRARRQSVSTIDRGAALPLQPQAFVPDTLDDLFQDRQL